MKSLEELNQYALSPITYIDDRPARVFFDRGATVDQFVEINENTTYFFPYGIDIEDITQFDVALVEYEIDLTSFTSNAVYLSWPNSITLPAYITVTRVGNYFTISGIRSASDWDLVKAVRVQPPFSVSGFKPQVGKITWFENAQATTRTEARWDVQLSLLPVEYFGPAALELYTSNLQDQQIAAPQIIVDPDEFDPEWTLEISPSVLSAVTLIYSTNPSEAETSWNPITKTFSITGDQTAVNNTLQDLEVDYARSDADFTFQYLLRNNFNLVTESQIQFVESRDFISDFDLLMSSSTFPSVIYGGVSNMSPFVTFDDVDTTFSRTRDPNPANYTATTAQSTDINAIFRTGSTMSVTTEQPDTDFIRYRNPGVIDCSASFGITADVEGGTFFRMTVQLTGDTPALGLSIDEEIRRDFSAPNIPETDLYINWGDGSAVERLRRIYDNNNAGDLIQYDTFAHTYDEPGIYDVVIYGQAHHLGQSPGFLDYLATNGIPLLEPNLNDLIRGTARPFIQDGSDAVLLGIDNFGELGIKATIGMLHNQIGTLEHLPDTFPSTVVDTRAMFANTNNYYNSVKDSLPSVTMDLSGWTVLNVTNMNAMFGYSPMEQFSQIGSWDVDNVTKMAYMFYQTDNVTDQDLNAWGTKTGNVTTMRSMFQDAPDATFLSLNNWDTSSVTDMNRMFLSTINNEFQQFNGNITSWNVSNVTDMELMFGWSLNFNQDISGWNMSSVVTTKQMFYLAQSFNYDLPNWNLSSCQTMEEMFDGSGYSGSVENWTTTTALTNMSGTFYNCDLTCDFGSNWNTSAVTDFSYCFAGNENFNPSTFNISTNSATDLTAMFFNNHLFNYNISSWNTSTVTSFRGMFNGCHSFDQNLGSWNISSATDIAAMFLNCLVFNNGSSNTINNWDTSNVTTIESTFQSCFDFNQPVSGWDISSVTDMDKVFNMMDPGDGSYDQELEGYSIFNQPLNTWDTSSATSMVETFAYCAAFNQPLDLWDTSNVTNMSKMFSNAIIFDQDISGWDVTNVTLYNNFDQNTSVDWTAAEKPSFP